MTKRPDLYTAEEAGKRLGIEPVTVRYWAGKLKLGAFYGRMRLLSADDLSILEARPRRGAGRRQADPSRAALYARHWRAKRGGWR